ncbi:DUF1648 domain-containing protein [Streptomyces noursei]|nr:DUF1648 domain-containing protein [Streptomyces noursei]
MKRSAPYAGPVNTRPRGWIAALPFILVTLILGACYAFVAGRLPERLATHFAVDGRPDGYSSPRTSSWTAWWACSSSASASACRSSGRCPRGPGAGRSPRPTSPPSASVGRR